MFKYDLQWNGFSAYLHAFFFFTWVHKLDLFPLGAEQIGFIKSYEQAYPYIYKQNCDCVWVSGVGAGL